MKKFYVIFRGRKRGIFTGDWEVINKFVEGYPNNYHKGYNRETAARKAYGQYRASHTRIKAV